MLRTICSIESSPKANPGELIWPQFFSLSKFLAVLSLSPIPIPHWLYSLVISASLPPAFVVCATGCWNHQRFLMLRQIVHSSLPVLQHAAAAAYWQSCQHIQRTWQQQRAHGAAVASSSCCSVHTSASCCHGHSSDDEDAETWVVPVAVVFTQLSYVIMLVWPELYCGCAVLQHLRDICV